MIRSTILRTTCLAILITPFGASLALADEPGDDMLKPDEINTVGVSSNPENDSGMFLGGGLRFGQARSTEGGSAGLAYLFKFEPGYQMSRGSWGRMELSGEILSGSASFRTSDDDFGKGTMNIPFGMLLKFGYGYSLGSKVFGVARVGVGPLMGKFEIDPGVTFESDTLTGIGAEASWLMVMAMNSTLDVTGGISYLHTQFDVGEMEGSGGAEVDVDRTVIVNIPAIEVGLRVRL